MYAIPITVDI